LSTEAHYLELQNALSKIKYDVLGLCEVKRTGNDTTEINGNIFHYIGYNNRRGSVGFIINSKWKQHIKLFKDFSDRVTVVVLELNKEQTLSIIQVYAPTSAASDDEMKKFYDDLQKAYNEFKSSTRIIVTGDFNSKVGTQRKNEEDVLGKFGYGLRNERGESLIQFARSNELFIANSLFQKRPDRKWTWKSPDQKTTNEIDFVLVSKSDKSAVKNVETLNRFEFSTDHRLVRMKFDISIKKKFHYKRSVKIFVGNDKKAHEQFNEKFHGNMMSQNETSTPIQIYENFTNALITSSECLKHVKKDSTVLRAETKREIEIREELIKHRKTSQVDNLKFIEQRQKVFKMIRQDERDFLTKEIEIALSLGSSLKRAKNGTFVKKSWIQKLKDPHGVERFSRIEISEIATTFYENLYSSKHQAVNFNELERIDESEVDEISIGELKFCIDQLKNNKATGHDDIPADVLKIFNEEGLNNLLIVLNSILKTEEIPQQWLHSNIILIHKSGDKSSIGNYRPISLICHLCKLFMKVIMNRISSDLDRNQPPEQAGFRTGYSTIDHIFTINQLIEKSNEYNKNIYFAFVDYQKAFDSLEYHCLWQALIDEKIDVKYIRIIKSIYENSNASIKLESLGREFKIRRGVRQGDPLSPKLFNSVLQSVFLKFKWESKGFNLNGKKISNIRFADDSLLIAETKDELLEMLHELKEKSEEVGLTINWNKTKIMTNTDENVFQLGNHSIEKVESYKYLGVEVSFKDRENIEISRRISCAWKAFWSYKTFFTNKNLAIFHKRRLMNVCVLPVFTYGSASWTLSDHNAHRLQVAQRAMERILTGNSRREHIRNSTLRKKTEIKDVVQKGMELKWRWAGHMARYDDERISKRVEKWEPSGTRSRGRPAKRWKDDITEVGSIFWRRKATNREKWKELEMSFIQQWIA